MLTAEGPKVLEFNARLGVPEASVELEHLRSFGREHQPRVHDSPVPDALRLERARRRMQHRRDDLPFGLGPHLRDGAERAHPSRVRPEIAVQCALVVVGERERTQAFEPSSLAASRAGPNTARPRASSSSASPATSGASGPTTVRSIRSRSANSTMPDTSPAATGTRVASPAMPAFPGADQMR